MTKEKKVEPSMTKGVPAEKGLGQMGIGHKPTTPGDIEKWLKTTDYSGIVTAVRSSPDLPRLCEDFIRKYSGAIEEYARLFHEDGSVYKK